MKQSSIEREWAKIELSPTYQPTQIKDDLTHPANAPYYSELETLQEELVLQMGVCTARQVQVAEMMAAGADTKEISDALGLTMNTISNYRCNRIVKKMVVLIQRYHIGKNGPTTRDRMRMLYRIAVNNEVEAPRIAIQAIAELNNMMEPATADDTASVTINLNGEYFPKE